MCRKLRIWSHLLKKSLMKNFIFYEVPCRNRTWNGLKWEKRSFIKTKALDGCTNLWKSFSFKVSKSGFNLMLICCWTLLPAKNVLNVFYLLIFVCLQGRRYWWKSRTIPPPSTSIFKASKVQKFQFQASGISLSTDVWILNLYGSEISQFLSGMLQSLDTIYGGFLFFLTT